MCNNSSCDRYKKSLNNKKVHHAIGKFLSTLTMDDKYMNAFESVMKYFWDHKQEVKESLYTQKQVRVLESKKRIDLLVKRCMVAKSPTLIT
jgi:hypothetical protein